ncbi:hypothetical protein RB614_34230 [Phytohabitans sp. ZYX-F-186]|uniref:Uncharacterized protein n=1 Tax=Phytohabitans maris TaxID=3071409 RepID=A0ABU0ZS72_9ACTN|nr:hypothetical protein [Phytohabitans sp. ZYX-F-186]MDQ7909591.1 hypothetical protein [Phytohabitans sp. ZYX-F-186]
MKLDERDAGAFLVRLTRLDPGAVVRLKGGEGGHVALWARLPWGVLVTRTVEGTGPDDATVSAADLLAVLGDGADTLPERRDQHWRWPLPPAGARVVETVPADDIRRIAAAAAGTLRRASTEGVGGRPVGQRALRDALLDHVAILVTHGESRVEVPQRLIQAVVRMGFLGRSAQAVGEVVPVPVGEVRVQAIGRWVGLAAPYGLAWLLPVSQFAVRPAVARTNG